MVNERKYPGSLHNHTQYSNARLRDCIIKEDDLLKYAIELGHEVVAITDHESVMNAIKVEKIYKKIKDQYPNSIEGYKYSPYGLYETAGTLNSSWGYKYYDQNWITPEEIAERKNRLNGLGINYLLNVGPDALGRIPSFSAEALLKASEPLSSYPRGNI